MNKKDFNSLVQHPLIHSFQTMNKYNLMCLGWRFFFNTPESAIQPAGAWAKTLGHRHLSQWPALKRHTGQICHATQPSGSPTTNKAKTARDHSTSMAHHDIYSTSPSQGTGYGSTLSAPRPPLHQWSGLAVT